MFIDRGANKGGDQEIWYGPLSNGAAVLLFFNRIDTDLTMTIDKAFAEKYIPILFSNPKMKWKATELWSSNKAEVNFNSENPLVWTLTAHGVAVFKLTPEKR